jgi:glycosyltransferase involved in cell wall biosynthesis
MISIVVAARDEARGIEPAMRSLLAQRYPGFEIIAVDDRSSDGTGAILDRLAREDPRLRVIHVQELPPGWLGKNHGLAIGAEAARGEWLLFTDADILMAPDTLSRGLGLAERHRADHLTVLPEVRVPGFCLQAFVTAFAVFGLVAARPWAVRKGRGSLGVGAFNLVRRSSYHRAGGHRAIPLRPDDDLKLGKILRRSGSRTEVGRGLGVISVEWYGSLREATAGLMKNSFAVVDYHLSLAVGGMLLYLFVALVPILALVLGDWVTRAIGAATLVVQVATTWRISRELPTPRRSALVFPVACLLLCWVLFRATALTLIQRGIRWRGTFYPLDLLRSNRI